MDQCSIGETTAVVASPGSIKLGRKAMLGVLVHVVDEIRLSGSGAFSIEAEKKEVKVPPRRAW